MDQADRPVLVTTAFKGVFFGAVCGLQRHGLHGHEESKQVKVFRRRVFWCVTKNEVTRHS